MSTKGGQIRISACVDCATSGRNFSKNAVVSAGVLYIFQLPANKGVRMFLFYRFEDQWVWIVAGRAARQRPWR